MVILLVISGVTGRSSSFNIHVLFFGCPQKQILGKDLNADSHSSNEGAGKVRQEKEASEGYVKESLWVTGAQILGTLCCKTVKTY